MTYESPVGVGRNAIADDQTGVFKPAFSEMAQTAGRAPPDVPIVDLLASGLAVEGRDGRLLLMPVTRSGGRARRLPRSATCRPGPGRRGSCRTWPADHLSGVRPVVWRNRESPSPGDRRVPADHQKADEPVLRNDRYLCGIRARARVTAGLGLWQRAFGSAADLTEADCAKARVARTGGVRAPPKSWSAVTIRPPAKSAARHRLDTETGGGGGDLPIDHDPRIDPPAARLNGPLPAAGWIKDLARDTTDHARRPPAPGRDHARRPPGPGRDHAGRPPAPGRRNRDGGDDPPQGRPPCVVARHPRPRRPDHAPERRGAGAQTRPRLRSLAREAPPMDPQSRRPGATAPRHQARHQARHRGPASGARHQARRRGPASGARHQARHRDPASSPAPGPGTPDAGPSRARALDALGLQPAATGAGFRDAPQIALAQKARPVCGPPAGASATAGQHPDPPRHASPCPAPPRVRRRRRIATPGWQPWRSGCESQGCQRLA